MNHWWRAYNEAVNDPKLQLLSDSLFRAWFNVMCIASASGGALPPLKDIAFTLRIQPTKAAQVLAQLHTAGLLDKTETGFIPHNWNGRQYKSDVSTERVKRFRKHKRNVSSTVSETPPETEDRNREQKDSEANASGAEAPPDPAIPEREYFLRGREVLGKGAGGMIGKLLKAKGGNVALARAAIEQASQKQNPTEYIAAICRGPPAARPTTAHQQERQTGREILDELGEFISRSGSQADFGVLRHDSGDEPQGVRGRPSGNLIELSPSSRRESG